MKRKTQILSTEQLNRHGYWLPTDGADMVGYNANPVLLWQHETWKLPIGTLANIRKENGNWVGDPVFDEDDYFALEIERKWQAGIISAGSIGFRTQEYSTDKKWLKEGQTSATPVKWEFLEYSFVNVPANAGCVSLSNGSPIAVPKIQNLEMDKKHLLQLGLAENATDEQITEAIGALKKGQVDAVLELGVAKGVVNEKNRPRYEKLAAADLDAVKGIFDEADAVNPEDEEKPGAAKSMEETLRLKSNLKNSKDKKKKREDWSFLDYSKKDPSELYRIKNEEPEKYKELVDEYALDEEVE